MEFVFCEGGDDLAVINGVAGSIGLADIQVEPFKGKDKLRNFLRDVQTRPEFSRNQVTAVGIVRDADADGVAAFQSVRDALLANGFKAPNGNGGFAVNGIKTGILIVGPKGGKGMVEDLCLNSVNDRPEFPCVDDYSNASRKNPGGWTFPPRPGFVSGWLHMLTAICVWE